MTKKGLKLKADKLFSLKVREKGECELNGLDTISCGGGLQCMHIITRSNHRLRWEENNALCGCAGHHRYYTTHPFEFYKLVEKEFPEKYAYVSEHRNEFWDKDIEKVLKGLE